MASKSARVWKWGVMADDKGHPAWTMVLSGATTSFGPPEFEAQIVLRGEAPSDAAAEKDAALAIAAWHAARAAAAGR
jgi:hypothetical protein